MAFQRIRIKNTNVVGKIPGADKLDTAELCINLKDQKLYSKDADGNVFELGKTAVNNGPTPPGSGNEIGDLWWDGDNLLVWNGSSWEIVGAVTSVNGEVGDVVLELGDLNDVAVDGVVDEQVLVYDANQGKWVPASAASLAVDVDLGYTPAPDKGTVTNTAGDDAELPLANATNAGLMSPADFAKLEDVTEIGDGTLTIKDANGDALGTFTANQVDDSEITIPAAKWEEIEGNPITIGGPQPNNPSLGDIWIDTGDCPPTINIWDDCDDPGNPSWTPIGGGGAGDAITFTAVITDDGTLTGNTPGHVLTASATNIVGGTAPIEYAYQWKSGGVATVTTKTYTLVEGDVGKIITCDVTVAEPDGTNPETRTATYAKVIEIAGTINKPTVLAPQDEAGSGVARPIVTDEITAVDNTAGSYTCETDLITNVDATYLANIQEGGFKQVGGSTVGGGLGGVTEYTIDFKTEAPDGTNHPPIVSARVGDNARNSSRLAFSPNYTLNVGYTLGALYDISDPGLVTQGEIATIRVVRTATVFRVYKNGILHKETPHTGQGLWAEWTSPMTIGAQFTTPVLYPFNGPLGFVKIWTSAAPDGTTEPTTGLILDAPLTAATQALDRVTGNNMSFEGRGSETVDYNYTLPERVLTLSGTKDLDCFEVGDVVQGANTADEVKIISIPDPQTDPPTITVDGGAWTGSDGTNSGDAADRETTVKGKTTSWDTTLTLAGPTDLDVLEVGNVVKMGMDADVPYQPVSDSIVSVDSVAATVDSVGQAPPDPWNAFNGVIDEGDGNRSGIRSSNTSNFMEWNFKVDQVAKVRYSYSSGGQGSGGKGGYFINGVQVGEYTMPYKNLQTSDYYTLPPSDNNILYSVRIQCNKVNSETNQGIMLAGVEVEYIDGTTEILNLTGDETIHTLTLSDKTDLAYFRKGDVVQEYTPVVPETYIGYSNNTSDADLGIGSMTRKGTETFGVKPTGGPSGQTQLAYEFDRPLANVDIGHFTAKSAVLDLYGSDTGADNSWVYILTIPATQRRALSGDTPYQFLKIVRTDAPGTVSYNNYGIHDSYIPLEEVKIIDIDDSVPSITVDGGEWSDGSGPADQNQDETWSNSLTAVGDPYTYPSTQPLNAPAAFDGSDSTYAVWGATTGSSMTLNTNIENVTTVTVGCGTGSTNSATVQVNGLPAQTIPALSAGDFTFTYLSPTTLTSVQVISGASDGEGSRRGLSLSYIDVDGKRLVDPTGDTKVTCVSPLKAPTNWKVEVIDTDNNQLSLSHATPDNNAQVWVANDNQAGTDFYVTGPNLVDEPLLTADVRLQSSLFATTPADVDTLKNIVWELNGAEQNAGTSNPYTPTLNTNTTYTVRVKHQGNALEDSPWSDSTTFTTGATRNLYTYYKERVEVLENRIAGIEADEVVDDATDVTLLTVIANLIQRVETLEGGA